MSATLSPCPPQSDRPGRGDHGERRHREDQAQAPLEIVPDAGHMVMLEAPAEVARLVEGFLAVP